MSQRSSLIHRLFMILQVVCFVFFLVKGAGFSLPLPAPAAELPSLYKRLGGYDVISKIIDEFMIRMWNDPQVGRFFVGMGTDTRNQLRQKNKLLMCKNTGGPCQTINRSMKLAHGGLGITESDWQIAITHLAETLKTLKIGDQEQLELLHIINGLKDPIIERPGP